MPTLRGARSYAQAIVEIARDRDALDRWEHELELLAAAVQEPGFVILMEDTRVPVSERVQQAAQFVPGLSPMARNLLALLVSKRRLRLLPRILVAYRKLRDAYLGIEEAEVVTAIPLEPEELEQLRAHLRAARGKEVRLRHRVDPTILGGLIIRVGDQLLDGSVRGGLEQLRRTLVGAR
jgi:F-type H+-transporting ATPase subunit delta